MKAFSSRPARWCRGSLIALSVVGPIAAQDDEEPVPTEVVVDANGESGTEPGGTEKPWTLLSWNGARLTAPRELWKTTGKDNESAVLRAGGRPINDPHGFANTHLAHVDPVFFLGTLAAEEHLWVFEPKTPQEPIQVLDASDQRIDVADNGMFVVHDGNDSWAYFAARDGNGTELWRAHSQTQGNPAATNASGARLHDLFGGSTAGTPNSSNPEGFVASGNKLYFAASAMRSGNEERDLRILDLADPAATPGQVDVGGTGPLDIVGASDHGVFFIADVGTGRRLYFSDGSGKEEVDGQQKYGDPSDPVWMPHTAAAQERLFFVATNDNGERGLWRVAVDGPFPLKPSEVTVGDAVPGALTAFRDRMFFVSKGNLWVANPSGNARRFWDLDEIGLIQAIATVGSKMFLVRGDNLEPSVELWCIHRGLSRLAEIPGAVSDLVPGLDRIFFRQTVDGREELWQSTGTTDGTQPLLSSAGSQPAGFTQVGDKLVFAASGTTPQGSPQGRELWVVDASGGKLLKNIALEQLGPKSSNPEQFTQSIAHDWVYFVATNTAGGRELWVTDGDTTTKKVHDQNPPNATHIEDLAPFSGGLYFVADDGKRASLWRLTEPANLSTPFTLQKLTFQNRPLEDPRGTTLIVHATGTYLCFTAIATVNEATYRRPFVTNGTKIATLGYATRTDENCGFAVLEDAANGDSLLFAADQGGRGIEACRVTFADIDSRLN